MRKCVVTPKGMKYVDLSPEEEAARLAEIEEEKNRPPREPRFEEQARAVEAATDIEAVKATLAEVLRSL